MVRRDCYIQDLGGGGGVPVACVVASASAKQATILKRAI